MGQCVRVLQGYRIPASTTSTGVRMAQQLASAGSETVVSLWEVDSGGGAIGCCVAMTCACTAWHGSPDGQPTGQFRLG